MPRVLVTGSSTGIGLATVLDLARAGHHVVATARNPAGAEHLHAALERESLSVPLLPLDVNDDASVAETFRRVLAEFGPLDALVNNAGVSPVGAVEDVPLAAFRQAMETNYFGAIRCIQAVLPSMRKRGAGCIVNVTSMLGRIALPAHGSYTATKYALEGLSESLAAEVKAFGIRVAIVEPGVIATEVWGKERPPRDSAYPHARRLSRMFMAALQDPSPATLVAAQIREIVEGDSWQLRYPLGLGAVPLIEARMAMSDEEWIDIGTTDEGWVAAFKRLMGLDVKL